ncbi:MAG: hypothetical protein FJ278_05955, partial [Planctomycetes bacterium]|nr:hypothetical protein [Planctomycetota bacterium]
MTRALRSMAFCVCFLPAAGASELDGPWISDTFFYWYTWDYQTELGGWMGGVHNTPLYGYYDSRTFKDNRHSLWLASEWGLTHHFMDYWDPNWKGEGGEMRERIVMRAAEDLRKAGYDIWMSYYQDGQNFEMKDFSKNVSEKRDVHQWLRDFARSPVWPKVNGYPLQLVYGRNGHPKTTKDDDGFRDFLRKRYADIAKLNADWGTSFAGFDQVGMDFGAKGHQRALSIKFQYETWAREWQRLDELVQKEFGLPGMKASFDVAYAPFLGFGYCDFARVFGGPHSYGGIFGQPQDQDVHRFIQAAVAKKYGTVFFDHFKNFYHDWNIRVPGAAFLPEPHHFDRFWVGALMRYAEALLHLSWNEWWEGSNLEPCYEYGKTYCEKNLFYATLMKLCFPSIQRWADGAQVAVILNDWSFLAGGRHPEDLYATIQTLRRLGCRFDLIPDDLLTAERLAPFKLVIAPSCGVGFSQEARAALLDWARGGQDRRLAVSADAKLATALGLKKLDKAALSSETGGDLNVFVDIGAESDEPFVVEGFSQRENWGKLPKGAFGEGTNATMRWTPGVGRATTLMLPLSPNREHVLRLQGSALWPNHAVVRLDGAPAAEFDVKPGFNEYEVALPASKVGGRKAAAVTIEYVTAHVPREQDPKRFPSEARVC